MLDLTKRLFDGAENASDLSIKQRKRVFRSISLQIRVYDDDDFNSLLIG